MANGVKKVRLKKSDTYGYGFSILGGAGSELPPVVFDIIEGSPAALSLQVFLGDVIWEVNGIDVTNFTTKEDTYIQQRLKKFLESSSSETLRCAITKEELKGIQDIVAKKSYHSKNSEVSMKHCPSSMSSSVFMETTEVPHTQESINNAKNKSHKPRSEAFIMTGDIILNVSGTSHNTSWFSSAHRPAEDCQKSGSCSMPASPSEVQLAKENKHVVLGSPTSNCSSDAMCCVDTNQCHKFTYPSSVRISKSEDQLQYPNADTISYVNVDLEDVNASLNTLLDTRDNNNIDCTSNNEPCAVWNVSQTLASNSFSSGENSVHSNHDSDSPLIGSPSLHSHMYSPSSSVQYSFCSASGVYDKICSCGKEDSHESFHKKSENYLFSNGSSHTTSPDTDIPDELEWDDPPAAAEDFKNDKESIFNVSSTILCEVDNHCKDYHLLKKKNNENLIIIHVAAPDLSKDCIQHNTCNVPKSNNHEITPTNSPASSPPSKTSTDTLSPLPETVAYQELKESEEEITYFSEEDDSLISGIQRDTSLSEEESSPNICSKKEVTKDSPSSALSPPQSEDESDIESLHNFHLSPRVVDMPSAVRLAKRLYMLDGFKKSDVSRHLSKNNEFSRAVAEEYLHYFNFTNDTLDVALRKFLDKFCLTGETQDRERVLVHFSKKYLDSNLGVFNSQDAVHTLTCALMLLNTDLHGQNVSKKMTCSEFIENLAELNDGDNFPNDILRSLYQAILTQPLKWAIDEDIEVEVQEGNSQGAVISATSNPFLSPPSSSGVIYKKGYVMPALGKRSWKMWYCVIQDLVLILYKDEHGARYSSSPIGLYSVRLHHALAQPAHDYSKKEHVLRLFTADQAEYLFQTSDNKELQAWIDTINFVSASLSSPPLPSAVGSQKKFQRPLLPSSVTKFNIREQTDDHIHRLDRFQKELEDHQAHPPDKSAKSGAVANYKEKEVYLNEEVNRYSTYITLLQSRLKAAASMGLPGAVIEPQSEKVVQRSNLQELENRTSVECNKNVSDESFKEELCKKIKDCRKKKTKENTQKTADPVNKNIGAVKRLSALFTFSKLNNTGKRCTEENLQPSVVSQDSTAPPLPPKPALDSKVYFLHEKTVIDI